MNYRTIELHSLESFEEDTTRVIDINITDPISSIVLLCRGTNTHVDMVGHYVACLPKIEIIDGSDVLFSLDGYESEALDWYSSGGKFRANLNWSFATGGWNRNIAINFGRYLWDRVYGLDPTKFNNLQLRITVDVDGGGNTNTPFYLQVMANVFDERVPSLTGFLMTKEIKQWTIASTVHEYTDLPTDYPYRAMYLRVYALGIESNQCFSNFKLTEDMDKKVPIDMDGSELQRTLLNDYPPVEEVFYFPAENHKKYIYCAATTRVSAYLTRWVGTALTDQEFAAYNGDGGRLDIIASVNGNVQILVKGEIPHAVFEIPFGLKADPEDAYNVAGIRSLKADITGANDAVGHLFVQQYRSY